MLNSNRIVFVGFFPGFGGAEKSMVMTANGLSKLGYNVYIISLKDNNVVYEIDSNVKYIFIDDFKGLKVLKVLKRFFNLKKLLKEIKPNVVISFWLQPAIFSTIISKFIGFKSIYSERGDPTDTEYKGILGFIRGIIFKSIDGLVFQTHAAMQCFSKSLHNKCVIIGNPVYIKFDDYAIPVNRRKVIVNVGRLHEQKNQRLLIDSFNEIADSFPSYTLEIYGDGELKDELQKHINYLELQNRVFLKGTTPNIFDEISNASLFVLSSDYEGMPNALMEAMALGLPCISVNWKPGAVGELISDKKNGIVTSRNSKLDLSLSIKYILEHPQEANNMGISAKNICNTHSVDSTFKLWDDFIMTLLKK